MGESGHESCYFERLSLQQVIPRELVSLSSMGFGRFELYLLGAQSQRSRRLLRSILIPVSTLIQAPSVLLTNHTAHLGAQDHLYLSGVTD